MKILSGIQIYTPYINEYKYNGITYPSKIQDWKMFEKNNPKFLLFSWIRKIQRQFTKDENFHLAIKII